MDNDSAHTNVQEASSDTSGSASPQTSPTKPSPLSGGLGIFIAILLLATAGYLSYRTLYKVEPEPLDPPAVMYICAETHETFKHKPKPGESNPIMSPHSKKKTGYPAEKCYWTKDGNQKLLPTYILLNDHIGVKDPTVCPDCGRVVIPHNPMPPKGTPLVKVDKKQAAKPDEATTKPADS